METGKEILNKFNSQYGDPEAHKSLEQMIDEALIIQAQKAPLRCIMGELDYPSFNPQILTREAMERIKDLESSLMQFRGLRLAAIETKDERLKKHLFGLSDDQIWMLVYFALRIHDYCYDDASLPHEKYQKKPVNNNPGCRNWTPETIKPHPDSPILIDLGDEVFAVGVYKIESEISYWAASDYGERIESEQVKGWCYIRAQTVAPIGDENE